LLKEIMENKNKKDPRCVKKIKEILLKNPKIKDYIISTKQNE